VIFTLPIPRYSRNERLHQRLADLAEQAEQIAAGVNISARGFQAVRRQIRIAIAAAGIAQLIDDAVNSLLSSS
jgi:hypothetical protein